MLNENPTYQWANLTLALSRLAQGNEAERPRPCTPTSRSSARSDSSLASDGPGRSGNLLRAMHRALEILKEGIARDEKEKDSSKHSL